MFLLKKETPVELANRIVKIQKVLEWNGIYVPDFSQGRSVKARCPFADMYHLDADASRSMRVYADTNSANCFMGCGMLTSVSVHAKLEGLSYTVAAYDILGKVGYKFKTFEEKWQEAFDPEPEWDIGTFRTTLVTYCENVSGGNWATTQYKEGITTALANCLHVLNRAKSVDEAYRWLVAARKVMKLAIEKVADNCLPDDSTLSLKDG